MYRYLQDFRRDQSGSTAIEYVLLGSLIFLLIIAGVTMIGTRTSNMFNSVANGFH